MVVASRFGVDAQLGVRQIVLIELTIGWGKKEINER